LQQDKKKGGSRLFYLFFFSHEGDDGMMCRKPACFYAVVAMFMGVMSGADPEGD
jgi:hypothetical protein